METQLCGVKNNTVGPFGNPNHSPVCSLCCELCHSQGVLVSRGLKLRSVRLLIPFASLVITAVEVIFGHLRRFLQGVDKLHVIC